MAAKQIIQYILPLFSACVGYGVPVGVAVSVCGSAGLGPQQAKPASPPSPLAKYNLVVSSNPVLQDGRAGRQLGPAPPRQTIVGWRASENYVLMEPQSPFSDFISGIVVTLFVHGGGTRQQTYINHDDQVTRRCAWSGTRRGSCDPVMCHGYVTHRPPRSQEAKGQRPLEGQARQGGRHQRGRMGR
ncbi:hypothetical protein E2C01_059121 [Portunus trituberculatus]|uniref:Uncharacterized protein n=1 Tax=Portunus trituberculatus TaxID=210409 RepID=A0A5B7H7H7_PORTR|nr:hypothetical protein [Portunus trituberculatus]